MNQQLLLKGIYSPMQPRNLLSKVLNWHPKLRENDGTLPCVPARGKESGNEASGRSLGLS